MSGGSASGCGASMARRGTRVAVRDGRRRSQCARWRETRAAAPRPAPSRHRPCRRRQSSGHRVRGAKPGAARTATAGAAAARQWRRWRKCAPRTDAWHRPRHRSSRPRATPQDRRRRQSRRRGRERPASAARPFAQPANRSARSADRAPAACASAKASVVPPRMSTRMAVSEMAVSALDITSRPWLSIVGIGEDGVDGLSPVARQLVASAELVVGGARHLALADALVRGERLAWPSPIDAALPQILARRGTPVTVLASGDPFHFGIGNRLGIDRGGGRILVPAPAIGLRAGGGAARLGVAGYTNDLAARPRAARRRASPASGRAHPGTGVGRRRRRASWPRYSTSAASATRA